MGWYFFVFVPQKLEYYVGQRFRTLAVASGQIKGKSGCVVCIDGTCYTLASIPPAGVSALWASEGSSDNSLLASSSPLPCATSSGPWLSANVLKALRRGVAPYLLWTPRRGEATPYTNVKVAY